MQRERGKSVFLHLVKASTASLNARLETLVGTSQCLREKDTEQILLVYK